MCGVSQPQTATPGEALWEHACNVWQIFLKHLRVDLKHSEHVGSSFGTGYFSQTESSEAIPVTLLWRFCLFEKPDKRFTYEYLPDIFLTTAIMIPARIPTPTMIPIIIPTSAIVSRPPTRRNWVC